MRILVNALSARRGGIITYTRNLMRSFADRKVDAVFALPTDSELNADVEKIYLPVTNMWPMKRAIWEQTIWRHAVKRTKPDVLYSSANFGLLYPPVPQVLLIREGGLFDPVYLSQIAPCLGTDSILGRALRRKLILASARASDLVLTPTEAMRELLALWDGELAGRVKSNLYGTRLDHFAGTASHPEWRTNGPLRVLIVSAYYPHKQPGLVSEAVRFLNERGLECQLSITMDMAQIDEMPGSSKDAFLLRKGIERKQVTLLGQVSYNNLPDLYRSHDLFVTASLSETFGHPLVEAMASGIIVAAADTPVQREVCGEGAVYFDGTSAMSLAALIERLDRDDKLRAGLKDAMKAYAYARYSWEGHVDRLLSNLESVALKRR